MRKLVGVFVGLVAVLIAIGLIFLADVPLSVIVSLGIGALSLIWLVLLLIVPWNVYFDAREVLIEIRTSRERGLEVSADRETEARQIAARMRLVAVGAHLVSALVIAVITYFAGSQVGYYFAGFYLLSTFFRPAAAWFDYLHDRLGSLREEVKYPRDDVVRLLGRVAALEEQVKIQTARLKGHDRRDVSLAAELADLDRRTAERDRTLERSLDAHGRQFEHSLSRLTDNQEVLAGLKAFLRLVRSEV